MFGAGGKIIMKQQNNYALINWKPTPHPRAKVREQRVFDKIWQHVLPLGGGDFSRFAMFYFSPTGL